MLRPRFVPLAWPADWPEADAGIAEAGRWLRERFRG
jgi:hypothetical protein